jgi:hypothetical protein
MIAMVDKAYCPVFDWSPFPGLVGRQLCSNNRHNDRVKMASRNAAARPTPKDNQLMSKHRVFSLKLNLRLERRGQAGQDETEKSDHSASLGDSTTSSTQMRFSVHTRESNEVSELL